MSDDERFDRLASAIESLQETVVARDKLIERLLSIVEKQSAHIAELERQWQAYLTTLPRQ